MDDTKNAITHKPEIYALTSKRFLRFKKRNKDKIKIASCDCLAKDAANIFLSRVTNLLNDSIDFSKKYFCAISVDNLRNVIFRDIAFETILVELIPVKVKLNNDEINTYVNIYVYGDDHFLFGREYNKMHDTIPSEGAEYNTIFASIELDN